LQPKINQAEMETKIELRIAELIYQISSILFLIVGVVTNMFSAIIYSKKKMRKTSYSVYLFALALADLCVTINGNTRTVLMYFQFENTVPTVTVRHQNASATQTTLNATIVYNNNINNKLIFKGFDIRETSLVVCRLQSFLSYYFLQLSSCLLCLLSIDRFFGIVLVLKADRFNRSSFARKTVLVLVLIIALFNLHFLIFMGHIDTKVSVLNRANDTIDVETRRTIVCDVDNEAANGLYKRIWTGFFYLDAIIYTKIPFVIMIACNVCIVAKIVKSRVRSKQVIIDRKRQKSMASIGSGGSSLKLLRNTSTMLATEKRISIILVSITFSFLVFTLPVFIVEHLECK
jgi:hypothetical protein